MNEIPNNPFEKHVFVCVSGKTCPGQGSEEVLELLRKEIKELGLKSKIRINKAGCFDQCGHGPLVVVYPDNVWYARVKPSDCHEIIESLISSIPVTRLLYDRQGKIT